MDDKNVYALNTKHLNVSINLISCYNTYVTKPVKNIHSGVEPTLYCAIITHEGGGCIYHKDDSLTLLTPNTIYIGHYKNINYMINDGEWRYYTYWFEVNGIEMPNGVLMDKEFENDDELCDEIIALLHENSVSSISLANSIMTTKLLQWLRLYQNLCPNNATSEQIVTEMKKYINANIQNNIKLNDIAAHFNYCEKHFRNLFKRYIGISPKNYMDLVRIEQAQSLLLTSSNSVSTIAKMLGFSSASHFMNVFKKHCKTTPSIYRASNQK